MQYIFVYLIFFLSISIKYSSSNYIQCTSQCPQITISFLQPLLIPNECQENNNNSTNIYDYALVCIIDYRIDYDAKQIYINLKASNDTYIFKVQNQSEFLIQTIWLSFNQKSKQPNITYRKYGCTTKNDCARIFYLNTIQYLVTDGKIKLDEINLKLFNQITSTRRRCKDTNKPGNKSITKCENGLCYAHNIAKKQSCKLENIPILFSEIEYYLPKIEANEREIVEYKCNKDLCNTNRMIKIIKNILLNYTNWNNIIINKENQITAKSSIIIQPMISYNLIILSLIFILN